MFLVLGHRLGWYCYLIRENSGSGASFFSKIVRDLGDNRESVFILLFNVQDNDEVFPVFKSFRCLKDLTRGRKLRSGSISQDITDFPKRADIFCSGRILYFPKVMDFPFRGLLIMKMA